MTEDRSQLTNFVEKFLGTVKFGNDHVAKIMGYGDYHIRNVTISRVYFVDRLGHNLFSVGQFCDLDLEVTFRYHTCFIRNLEGVDLLSGSQGNNPYTISLEDMMKSSPICLLSKASKTKSWLWHRRLSHLNFGKRKKKSHKPKSEDTNQEKLYLLHMDLCGQIRVESVNGKKYILVIVDDYSRFTWVKCLRSKDEAPDFIIKFLKMIHVGISHETSVARSPHQNSVVERRNCTLNEVARTMLIYAKAPLFLWAEAVDTACYTQNRSIIRLRHGKTLYEILHDKLPSFFHVFGALYYPTNDSENLGKLQPKADIGIFIGYAPTKKAFWIYNRRTRRIIETIHFFRNPLHQPVHRCIIPNDVEDDNHDLAVTHLNNDPFFGIPILEVPSDQSSSTDIIHTIVQPRHQISESNNKWTKDHPLKNIIDQLARPVSTRLCFDSILLDRINARRANEFERLEVWELVPRPDKVMVISLKWIYKVRLDELGGILKNKARLVARGYRQEEGIYFGESFDLVARLEAIRNIAFM
nr:retrovirus-related Pol polyprotein from transposon TNT 1-94 [Tanacetum cinerariifolium]